MFEVSCTFFPCISGDLLASLFLLFRSKILLLLPLLGHFTRTNISSVTFILTYIFQCPHLKTIRFGGGGGSAYYVKKNKATVELAVLMVV
jgi:hypothetical protein